MRIVSLLPGATDIVVALGAADQLVAVTHECDLPRWRATLPRVTSTPLHGAAPPDEIDREVRDSVARGDTLFRLDDHAIAAARPDVILTQALCDVCAVSEGDVRHLAARLSPSPAVVTLSGTTFATVFDDVRRVAAALGLEGEGEELIDGATVRLRRVHRRLKAARAPRPRVAVIEWTDPIYAAGHWVPEMIAKAGGIDVLGTPGEHSTVRTSDQVRGAAPDVLWFAPCGYDVERAGREAETLRDRPEWAWARELPWWAIDANRLTSRPSLRIVEGVEVVAAALHPSLFSPPPDDCVRAVVADTRSLSAFH